MHHELIPGHHLQGFMNQRYNEHRRPAFGTPFWTEGWALYWEMILWDQGFNATPEDRIGALFWRMHGCARILFSLGFHLGTMTPQQAIDMLVDRVGHERANAEAEVRRSFLGTYPPLYQLAYMMGGLQFRALHQELVGSGKMTNKDFAQLAQCLGVPRVLVGGGVYDSTGKGLDSTIADLWSYEYAMLAKIASGRDIMQPCIGRTFLWSADSPSNAIVEEYREEQTRSDVYRVRHHVSEELLKSYNTSGSVVSNISAACGYLLSNIHT